MQAKVWILKDRGTFFFEVTKWTTSCPVGLYDGELCQVSSFSPYMAWWPRHHGDIISRWLAPSQHIHTEAQRSHTHTHRHSQNSNMKRKQQFRIRVTFGHSRSENHSDSVNTCMGRVSARQRLNFYMSPLIDLSYTPTLALQLSERSRSPGHYSFLYFGNVSWCKQFIFCEVFHPLSQKLSLCS